MEEGLSTKLKHDTPIKTTVQVPDFTVQADTVYQGVPSVFRPSSE